MRPALLALLTLSLAGLLVFGHAASEEDDELVTVELSTVGLDRQSGTPVALLREPESGEVVPIFIGVVEAQAILQGLHEVDAPRPMTHDLLANTIQSLDAQLEALQVHDLRNGTYHGRLLLSRSGEDNIRVDSRPSDGLALAVRTGSRIEVTRKILRADLDFDFEAPEGSQDVVRAAGITVVAADSELRQELELPEDEGMLVSRVEGAAADQGIQPGDLILAVDEVRPDSPLAFLDAIRAAGDSATLTIWRDGAELEITVPTDIPATREREQERL
ncbi:bifunctional DNase/RNase [Natronospira proteinivora]|uniref:Bifunctional DNase/RNase n=1 Tax=Natronospira proteinivora TaxID=1807133 RepID=A0ABT1G5Y8_9GAMM|nr:bifunctional nuclease domain-containing protein [Natronospira proteinivora]MCP1726719.1 bifunctional DNase/RNase [Natronospira proteinivora]